jgi:formylglycine-generating enzyme required for sulfatase activity
MASQTLSTRPSETQHKKRIGRTFAIATKSVTVEEYRKFNARYGIGEIEGQARTADSPVIGTSWYQAVAYCNWLSKEEGIPEDQWCYEIKGNVTKLKEKYLSLTGYRLPTEAEMEYATRAGALTSRYYGETEELLSKYAWYDKNSQERTWPVGILKPNDLGLFDVQGNVSTWCQESFKGYPQGEEVSEDKEDALTIVNTNSRVLRGGSFLIQASNVRSSNRDYFVPSYRDNNIGFRLARTFIP